MADSPYRTSTKNQIAAGAWLRFALEDAFG